MATHHSYKNPPAFTSGEQPYESWKNEIEVWRLVTDLPKEKQALAVTLTLKGQARAKALELDVKELNKDNGLDKLITALDRLFLKDTVDLAYAAYSNFDTYRRPADSTLSMADFIIEFERRYDQCKKYKMELPEAVLSFKLLDNALLTPEQRHLALTAASDMNFNTMKSGLKRIFGSCQNSGTTGSVQSDVSSITVKQESAYYTRQTNLRKAPQGRFAKRESDTPKGTNPLNKFGHRTKCAICQSVFHWVKDCPHRSETAHITQEKDSGEEQCNLTLLAQENLTPNEIFLTEALGSAVIDTACTRTVCGKKWIDNYVDNLDEDEKSKVSSSPSQRSFRFGDGALVKSFENVHIPAVVGDTPCMIDTEVVEADLPLLLSKASLKKADTVLDLSNDKATMFKKPVKLEYTSTGHYCIDLHNRKQGKVECNDAFADEAHVLAINEAKTETDKKKMLSKLHKQFGHATAERLQKLLQSAGTANSDILKLLPDVIKECEICVRFGKPAPKPIVSLPLASEFNETVAVDLHELEKTVWYLHILDEFTRFSAGAIVRNKTSSLFVQKFIQHWISVFGAPRKLFSDNGGEFNNKEVHDMCENFNIEVKTTAGYSPWSNGVLERHNQTLTSILLKVKAEQNCNWETALSWALMAKNTLCNVHGFSSYQLVFGMNPNLPSVLTDQPPALEGTTSSTVVGEHIASMYKARRAFTQADSSERIRRALRRNVRPGGGVYVQGDKVFYKRPDSQEWKGPAVVIGQDGPVVIVKHGGMVVRVHQTRLRKKHAPIEAHEEEAEKMVVPNETVVVQRQIHVDGDDDDDAPVQNNEVTEDYELEQPIPPRQVEVEEDRDVRGIAPVIDTASKVKPGQVISHRDEASNSRISAKVVSRAGKSTGKFKHWYNLEYSENEGEDKRMQAVDVQALRDLQIGEQDQGIQELQHDNDSVMMVTGDVFEKAKLSELMNWKDHQVFTEIADSGQKCISTRWVCTLKETPQGIMPKARLVARGFEEFNADLEKDSPTLASESLRMILAVIAQNEWEPHSMDIKTAFLQGTEVKRDIYIRPPPEADSPQMVWRLNKCVYGLSDASLYWYNRVKTVMLQLGATVSKVDPAVFYWTENTVGSKRVRGILGTHVDDFIWGGDVEFEGSVIEKIRELFNIGREDTGTFQFIGMNLSYRNGKISLDQDKYADCLSPLHIEKDRAMHKQDDVTDVERKALRSKVGQILWTAHQSRPDIAFDASNLAAVIKTAKVADLVEANKLVKRIKSDKLTLQFQNLGHGQLSLVVYSDASLGNLADGGTQGGHLVLLMGESGLISPICWSSKKIKRVVRSTLAGETLAMADGVDAGIFLATLYGELTSGMPDPLCLPIVCVTDCKSLYEAVKSNKFVTEKRLRLEISGIKDMIENGQVREMRWSDTKTQLADCLTKRGASPLLLMKAIEEGKVVV